MNRILLTIEFSGFLFAWEIVRKDLGFVCYCNIFCATIEMVKGLTCDWQFVFLISFESIVEKKPRAIECIVNIQTLE